MKKYILSIMAMLLIFSLVSCAGADYAESNQTGASVSSEYPDEGATGYAPDYANAASFEKELNDGVKVNGKTVQFSVVDYKPDSALGINCWAGEHLNFISEEELDVSIGDIIIGKVTQEPDKVLGSWKIPYEVLSIIKGDGDTRTQKNGFDSTTNEIYVLADYTVEIPKYWESERLIPDGTQRYAETGGKVAMVQISADAESDDDYPVTFDGLMDDNDNMIEMIEASSIITDVTDYEVIDTGAIKGILYKGAVKEKETGVTGYGEWFVFASEEDRNWCSLILCQTDNTDYLYTDDFMKMIQSIKPAEDVPPETTPTDTAGAPERIVMPNSSAYYCGEGWTLEELTEHFKELGFTNIVASAYDPDDEDYRINIKELYIQTGLFSKDPWEAGEEYKADAEITIYYNEFPLLTVENCPALVTVLTSKEMSYMAFANSYDGKYVEFDAYVTNHHTYDGGTSHIIEVTGGDYDGVSEISPYDEECFDGLIIRIGDRTWGNSINKGVDAGDHVRVSGRIDASWSEFYETLYVETMTLERR